MTSVKEVAGIVIACTIGAGIGLTIGALGSCSIRYVLFRATNGTWPTKFWRFK